MTKPISPPPETGDRGRALPAYLSNGLIGLRVREIPLVAGMTIVNGYVGEHHERRVEAAVAAPYPLGGDIALGGLWMSQQPQVVRPIDQAYDFGSGELTTRFAVDLPECRAQVTVLTFASRSHPTLVCQEIEVVVDSGCDLEVRARVDVSGLRGRQVERRLDTPGEAEPVCDGTLLWRSEGDLGECGVALLTEALSEAERHQEPWDDLGPLSTTYRLKAVAGRPYRFRQTASLVPSVMHNQPQRQAARLIQAARELGFDELRKRNRAAWDEIWKGRIILEGAGERWQGLADAAYYYLNASVHQASPASTSIYGLASWIDYHYYFGHVMWDVDAFAIPPLSLIQPNAAASLLAFRTRTLEAARNNAMLQGLRGLKFPWEAGAGRGEEAAPGGASAAAREDHINLHVARGFAFHADATGDKLFLRDKAWPVLEGVAEWLEDRVEPAGKGYAIREVGGPAERKEIHDNDAVTLMTSRIVLQRTAEAARQLRLPARPAWNEIAEGLEPVLRDDGAIADHEGYRTNEEQGGAPSPLLGYFPYWAETSAATMRATFDLYLGLWPDFVGSPMLPALYGVWAAWAGDRALSLKLMEEGYGAYQTGRFAQTLEYRLDKFPDGVASGPFFANIGGFLTGLLFGFPGLKVSSADPADWAVRPVVLPKGWTAIRCERLWVRGKPMRLVARHGAERATLEPV
ncbi:MAG: glycosyl hydrolase family 65 [Caulobacter sp.]|nr:glycosyl hydrolase family 65 [Caulobacter sp.]